MASKRQPDKHTTRDAMNAQKHNMTVFAQITSQLPIGGLFRFWQTPQTTALARILRSQIFPCGEGWKGRFGRFSGYFPTVFLRLKRPPTFPLTRHSPPHILPFSAFFLTSVAWMSREKIPKSSPRRTENGFEVQSEKISNLKYELWAANSRSFTNQRFRQKRAIGCVTRFPNNNKNNRKKR